MENTRGFKWKNTLGILNGKIRGILNGKIRFTPTKVSSDFEYVIRLYFSRFCPMGLAHLGSGFWKSFYSSGFTVGTLNAPELNI